MRRAGLIFVLLALIATACGSSGPPNTTACSAPTDEALDPSSGLHVLRPDDVSFDDLTPTSGPHLPAGGPLGLQDQLPAAQQVAVLERGSVIVSVNADDPTLLDDAAAAFGADAVVQPVAGLPSAVVATAWRSRVVCSSLDVNYVKWFVTERTGQFAQEDHNPES